MQMSKTARKPRKTRAETKQATRVTLIEAGIAEISKHGLEASLDAICARADLTRGAFYVHFADREAFLIAVMQHVLGGFVQALTSVGSIDLAAAVRMFFAAVGSPALHPAGRTGRGLRFHHVMEACRRSPVIGKTYRGLIETARERLATDPAIGDLLVVCALGTAAALELEVPIDSRRLGDTILRLA